MKKENRWLCLVHFSAIFLWAYIWVYHFKNGEKLGLNASFIGRIMTFGATWKTMWMRKELHPLISKLFPNTVHFPQYRTFERRQEYGVRYCGEPVWLSVCYNESDETIDELFNSGKFIPIHSVEKGDVYMILFKATLIKFVLKFYQKTRRLTIFEQVLQEKVQYWESF